MAEKSGTSKKPSRRVGATASKTRDLLLDCVERLMLEKGYAGVTYRAVATKAGVTAGLVQYYFPTLDDVFLAAIRRRSEENVERLAEKLAALPDEPLRVLWEYSRDESRAALTFEFMALGNHRKSIRAEIAEVTEKVRRLQMQAIDNKFGPVGIGADRLSPTVLLFLLTGVPKLVRLEQGVGVSAAHEEVVTAFEDYLDSVEPRSRPRRAAKATGKTTSRSPGARRRASA